MTSKEEKLIEELNKCETQKSYENVRYTLIDDELRAYIEESLERLEVLEKANVELVNESTYYQVLKDKYEEDKAIAWEENEKLKKAIEIIANKIWFAFGLDAHKDDELLQYLTQQEYELLKEVLGK